MPGQQPADGSGSGGPSLVEDMPRPAEDGLLAEDRLRSLVELNRSIVAELSLAGVLRRIVDAARAIAQAQYAALGVIGADGGLEQFVHVGMDDETVAAIGRLPEGKGVLGALITDPRPVRVASIADHPRSSGFPSAHPPMTSFLGVPIQSRGEIFGNLYLTNRLGAAEFSAEDEELVVTIAATAGVAIENARLYEESRRQQEWLRAWAEVTRDLLQGTATTTQNLTRIADVVRRLTSADVVSVVFRGADPDVLTVQVSRGEEAPGLLGMTYPVAGSLVGEAFAEGRALRLEPGRGDYYIHLQEAFDVGPVLACPLFRDGQTQAAVVVGRRLGSPAFTDIDLQVAEAFANQAAVALELADRRESQRRLEVLEDRARIARDLHDHTIQRLWAAGLTVQAGAVRAGDPAVRESLQSAVESLDATIRQIRTTIFELQDSRAESASPRSLLIKVVAEVEPVLGFAPDLVFIGPLDTLVQAEVLGDAEAVLREGLTSIAKHTDADRVSVTVEVSVRHMVIQIVDNGSVSPTEIRDNGLAYLERRARRRGGALTFSHDEDGSTLRWSATLDA